ncbi:hypothetical protein C7Y69_21295 [Alteromonas sp. KS69]|jgi:hypothetical protein|uniref:hypothetical protein n=1 Tax=Alteromonas TaxID=226 RepID=UPI000F86984D|nr:MULTISPECIES: hypothetical protein [Alteromonas]MBO7924594.1 hypothetical protein [Alteromonas sp. K632G]MDP2538132.1 hypothetical protein [Alteromonas stellipolaris]RUP75004.1 hypothetical protein C7Y69_21295 [Alteromonas sp. KS69]|tara:strand:- start:1401 stop:1835 length:435 start_codon:yes stop_codon:yes gene_type:complete
MSIISIGGQAGGPKDGGIGRIKVDLYKALRDSCSTTYCEAVDEYSPVLRVDGSIQKFGDEEITRLRFAKKQRYITADIQIPEAVWSGKTKNELRDYIAQKVRESIVLFVARLKKDKIEVDEDSLFRDIDVGISQFTSISYEGGS